MKSFFNNNENKNFIAVARAGNVIGGGDWSEDRLIPDCIRACLKKRQLKYEILILQGLGNMCLM